MKVKSFEFAVAITLCCRELASRKEYVLSKQLLRAGTSIGANVREALNANSKRDFAYRLSVSLRECDETLYWLELLKACHSIPQDQFNALQQNANELIRILTSIVKTIRATLK